MFKASIFLVAAALITLAYGWVSGINTVLYASIGFSAFAGLALLASTMADRKKYPREERQPRREQEPRGRADKPAEAPRPVRREVERGWQEASRQRGYGIDPSWTEPGGGHPPPERAFRWSEEEGPDEEPVRPEFSERGTPGSGDFRSRLAAALADSEPPARRREAKPAPSPSESKPEPKPQAETEEVEQDWIRIDDLPGMSGAPEPSKGLRPARKPRKPRIVEAASTRPTRPRTSSPRSSHSAQEGPDSEGAANHEAAPSSQGEQPRPRIRPKPHP